MYKGHAPRISGPALAERRRHLVQFLDNQQKSEREKETVKNWVLKVSTGQDSVSTGTWRSMLISSSERSVSGMS